MLTLLSALTYPYLRAHVGRVALTLLGVVIGVQGMVAMGALSASAVRSFARGIDAIAGTAQLQVVGPPTGIPDALVPEVAAVEGIESAIPVIQGSVRVAPSGESIQLFGVDLIEATGARNPQFGPEHVHIEDELLFLNSGASVALATPLLERLQTQPGSQIVLITPQGPRTFTIRGFLDAVGPATLFEGAVGLLDLSVAAPLFLAPGLVEAIYVTVSHADDVDLVTRRLEAQLAGRARVERTSARGRALEGILASLRVALSLASLITMIVAFFIIYQSALLSVEQRAVEIATARALGFTQRAVTTLFIVEAVVLGTIGALGGVVGGYVLARVALRTALAGIAGLYLEIPAADATLPILDTTVAAAFGLGVCVLAGGLSAASVARQPPASVFRARGGQLPVRSFSVVSAAASAMLLVVAVVTLNTDLWLASWSARTAWIMLGHTTLIVGIAGLAPAYVRVCASALLVLKQSTTLPLSLAIDFFSRKPRTVAAIVSAIMVVYALVVVLGTAVRSIEQTTGKWIADWFRSDLVVATAPGLATGSFDDAIASRLRDLPGVATVERYRNGLFSYRGQPVVLATFDRHNRPDRAAPLMLTDELPGAFEAAEAGRAVFVSESFAFRFGEKVGNEITLDTADGAHSFVVAALARDYAMDLGTVLVDIDTYQRLWRDRRLKAANIWQRTGSDAAAIRRAATEVVQYDPRISVVTNREYRAEVKARGSDLLQVLKSLQIFACIIAMLGVVNFLSAAVLDRRREIALLRSIGLTRQQVRQSIVAEAGLIGLFGVLLGIIEGVPAAYYMATHSIRVAMSWSLDFSFPLMLASTTAIAIVTASALSGYLPARGITKKSILEGLRAD